MQEAFRKSCFVDMDGDGKGEFGTFRELSAAAPLRGNLGRKLLDPPLLSPAFHALDGSGTVRRAGYEFRLYLPAKDGTWVCADGNPFKVAVDAAESRFCAFAWPTDPDEKHHRTFRVDETGTVRASDEVVEPATLHAADPTGWKTYR